MRVKGPKVMKAPVAEIFYSHQGEGIHVGEPQVFVRFVGCNLRCRYCDTPGCQTIGEQQKFWSVEEIRARVDKLAGGKPVTVSVTGGEPLLYSDFLAALLPALKKARCRTYLETNGTLPESYRKVARWVDVVAMDMKVASDCGAPYWAEHKRFLALAKGKAFVKLVVTAHTTAAEAAKAADIARAAGRDIPFVLQIASPVKGCPAPDPAQVFALTQAARKKVPHAFASPQMHKVWEIR